MSVDERPLGVTIIGVLGIIFGLMALLLGLAVTVMGVAFIPWMRELSAFFSLLGGFISVVGIVIAFAAAIALVISWGLLSRKYWAWLATLICEVLAVIAQLGTALSAPFVALPGLAVAAVVIWYLLQPHVRAWFERKPAPGPAYPPPPPAYA